MSVETRISVPKRLFQALRGLGNKDIIDYSNEEVVMLHPELFKVLNELENGKLKKEVENPVNNTTGGSSNSKIKSEMKKKYEAPSISVEKMTPEKLEEMINTLNGNDKEIGDK